MPRRHDGPQRHRDTEKIYLKPLCLCVSVARESAIAFGIAAMMYGGGRAQSPNLAKTIANFWPYATTLFDFTRRAMPWQAPRTLTSDEVYALTAYLLSINKIIGAQDVMNAQTLPNVRMPNRDGF